MKKEMKENLRHTDTNVLKDRLQNLYGHECPLGMSLNQLMKITGELLMEMASENENGYPYRGYHYEDRY
ncbi:MAG: hypothetical protein ACLSVX_01610 [Massilimicrobiota timonensis]